MGAGDLAPAVPAAAVDGAKEAGSALWSAALATARANEGPAAGDARVTAAFALGWQVAELHDPGRRRPAAAPLPGALPTLGMLPPQSLALVGLDQVDAALRKLAPALGASGVPAPPTAPVREAISAGKGWQDAVTELHVGLLGAFTAADFRVGKAYGLGVALAGATRHQPSAGAVREALTPERVGAVQAWIADLASVLPAHAAHAVTDSVGRWSAWVSAHDGGRDGDEAVVVEAFTRQGQRWRALLSGEKLGPDMLEVRDYLGAAERALIRAAVLARTFLRRFWVALAAAALLFAGSVVLLLVAGDDATTVAAGLAGILASAGVSWKSAGATLGTLAGRLERPLWGAELDTAIADAITGLPPGARRAPQRKPRGRPAAS